MLRRLPPGVRFMVLSALAFSVMSVLVKAAGERLPSQEIVLARALVSLGLSWLLLRRAGVRTLGSRRGLLLLRGLSPGSRVANDGAVELPPAGRPDTSMRSTHPDEEVRLCAVQLEASSPIDR